MTQVSQAWRKHEKMFALLLEKRLGTKQIAISGSVDLAHQVFNQAFRKVPERVD